MLGAVLALAAGGFGEAEIAGKKKVKKQPRGPYPSLGKCPVFPAPAVGRGAPSVADQSAWNQDISASPVHPNSAAIIARINATGGDFLHPDFGSPRRYGFPYSVTRKRAKPYRVKWTAYGEESTRGRYRIPAKALIEGGQGSDGDRHAISINRKRCRLYELYRAFFVKGRQGRGAKEAGKPRWKADSGVIWNLRSPATHTPGHTSADAAGLPIFPGLVRYDEAAAGRIHHALRMTVEETRRAWILPAVHCASEITDPNAPPMGMRLRLRASHPTGWMSGPARAIAEALKRYGVLIADNGANWFVSGTSDRRWNDANLDQLKSVPGSAFEVVRSAAAPRGC